MRNNENRENDRNNEMMNGIEMSRYPALEYFFGLWRQL